ncbi:M23 family metallopeptidase [Serinibacter arcticus]|uniref:M23 family metallopeptidase n=1 Tax=Serinibacter arcticus TaxID=1655435 RepID=UPI0011B23141|nr:M23 family metallopeptidase [Serinibacter arcticus]
MPELTTRRARRLAAPSSAAVPPIAPTAHTPVVLQTIVDIPSPAASVSGATSATVTLDAPAPLTRRELRQRQAGEAFGLTAPTGAAPAERRTAADVLAAAVLEQQGTMTRRQLREATRREAGLTTTQHVDGAPHVSLQQDQFETVPPADQPVDLEFDFASVALTLSSLAVAPAVRADRSATPVHVPARPAPTTTEHDEGVTFASGGSGGGSPRAGVASVPSSPSEPGTVRQWVPRLAVLSALGVATVVTPIHAIAQGADEPEVVEIPLADSSALDTLVATPQSVEAASATATADVDASVLAESAPADSTAALLASDPVADVRGVVAASRSEGRSELPQCGAPEADQPNGTLAALESSEHLTLSMPVQEGVYRVSSGFGPRWGAFHYASDFAAPLGTPIRAVAGGEVVHAGAGLAGRSPNLVAIRSEIDGETVEIWYNHMFDDGVFVEEGDVVNVGDVIGEVGNNGNSTGPHLHLEIHVGNVEDPNGSAVDPLAWLRANGATPVTTSGAVCV